ncbi:MAG TPA: hypothetical protein VGH65_07330, partial [Verrucomicrobiaceae bacterium]
MDATFAAHTPDVDMGRVVFIIMLLIGGFFQWLTTWLKKKRAEAAKITQPPPGDEELKARERAWKHETGLATPEVQAPPVVAASNPFENFLKTLRELSREEIMPPPPVMKELPPEIPKSPSAKKVKTTSRGVQKAAAAVAPAPDGPQRASTHPLRAGLVAVGGLRNAVVLREILG